MPKKFHINPDTKKAGECTAKVKCRFNFSDDEHYSTQLSAEIASSHKMEAEFMDTSLVMEYVIKTLHKQNDDGVIYYQIDVTSAAMQQISELTQNERENLLSLKKMVDYVDNDFPKTPSDKIIENLKAYRDKMRPDPNSLSLIEGGMDQLAEDLYFKTKWKLEAKGRLRTAPPRKTNTKLTGLKEAQLRNLQSFNEEYCDSVTRNIGFSAEKHFNETLDRIVDGENLSDKYRQEPKAIIPNRDRVMAEMDENVQLYLSGVFPEKELKIAMDKNEIDEKSVDVGTFHNTREWGNTYTVSQPNGQKRTFSIYEHRNSGEIIINGRTNWDDKNELPYANFESKYDVFARAHPHEAKKTARVLAEMIKSAQDGTLESDAELVAHSEFFSDRQPRNS